MEGHRGSLSILGHFMSVVEVVGKGRLLVFVHQIWVGAICSDSHSQQTVNNDICIPVRKKPRSKASEGAWTRAGRGTQAVLLSSVCSDFLPPDR